MAHESNGVSGSNALHLGGWANDSPGSSLRWFGDASLASLQRDPLQAVPEERDGEERPQSMIQRVMGQIRNVDADLDITIATGESQEFSIERQVEGEYSLVLEQERRDTVPAIMLACAHFNADPESNGR